MSAPQPQQTRPVPALAIAALIAGVAAVILIANLPARDVAWAYALGAAAVILAITDTVNATRAGRPVAWLAIIGGVVGLLVTILGGVASLV